MDLYEFPVDYVGRKTYVHVNGHSRSVPKPYTGIGWDGRNHVLPEYGGSADNFGIGDAPMIMRDIAGYKSPLEAGVHISSRSAHRDHMRKHEVIEVGTQPLGSMKRDERAPMSRAGYEIARALNGR